MSKTFEQWFEATSMDCMLQKYSLEQLLKKAFDAGVKSNSGVSQEEINKSLDEYYSVKPAKPPKIVYPDGDIQSVEIKFANKRSVSHNSIENAESIVMYWAAIPYVGEFLTMKWVGNFTLLVNVDTTKSTSDDIGARNILELLYNYLENGTPLRKNGTRAVDKAGEVKSIVGYE